MLDIKRIRTDFDAVAEKLATRGVDAAVLNEMKEIDAKRRESRHRLAERSNCDAAQAACADLHDGDGHDISTVGENGHHNHMQREEHG